MRGKWRPEVDPSAAARPVAVPSARTRTRTSTRTRSRTRPLTPALALAPMRVARTLLVAMLVVLVVLSTTSAAAPASSGDGPPEVEVGDTWTYRWTMPSSSSSSASTTTEVREVTGRESLQLADGSHAALVMGSRMVTRNEGAPDGVPRAFYVNATAWLATSDLSMLREETETGNSGPNDQGGRSTMTYERPCVRYVWPLTVGSSWTSRCTVTTSTTPTTGPGDGGFEDTSTRTTTYRVLRMETVTVPAGTFKTFVVEATTDDGTAVEWYAPSACGPVKATYDAGGPTAVIELTSTSCQRAPASAGSPDASGQADGHGSDDEGTTSVPGPGALAIVAGTIGAAAAARRGATDQHASKKRL